LVPPAKRGRVVSQAVVGSEAESAPDAKRRRSAAVIDIDADVGPSDAAAELLAASMALASANTAQALAVEEFKDAVEAYEVEMRSQRAAARRAAKGKAKAGN
jgi:hypothetical protein